MGGIRSITKQLPNGEFFTGSPRVVEIITKLQEIPRPLTEETRKQRDKQGRIAFPLCRILTNSACVLLGGVLCLSSGMSFPQLFGSIGIGTVITAFFMGPLIEFFNKTVSRPLLGAKTETNSR